MSRKSNDEKVKKEIDNEIKNLNEQEKPKKKKKRVRLVRAFENKEEEYKRKKVMYILEITVLVIFSLIMLVLLCNRTFFREEYKTSKIKLNIPLLMFFEKDTGNEITLKTLRKSKYVTDFFDGELSKMTQYNCNGYRFFYDDERKTAIYDKIEVEKDGAIKTVKIEYAVGDADCLCSLNLKGKDAEAICNK